MAGAKPSPEDLMWDAIVKGDLQAFGSLYRMLYPGLFHYAAKLTARTELAEDALHDTFAYIWQHRQQLGGVSSVRFYLLQAVRNQCLKLLKKEGGIQSLDIVESQIVMAIQPEEIRLKEESAKIRERLDQALQELSPRQREIIFLKYFNNIDYEEIAALLSINYQSVLNHVHKAIVRLRQAEVLQHFRHEK